MVGTMPEGPGQPAFSPMDVEPASENDLRRPGFLSSQKRTVQFNRFWDQSTRPMSAQAADGGTCQSNSFSLASSGHFQEAPASTAIRNASSSEIDADSSISFHL